MSITTIPAMLNVEPHYFEAKFNKPYEQITADDIIEKAMESLMDYRAAVGSDLLEVAGWLFFTPFHTAAGYRLPSVPVDRGSSLASKAPRRTLLKSNGTSYWLCRSNQLLHFYEDACQDDKIL
ncbi:hypothetical protein LXA43DRAFT_1068375 [Ganoderma leucocontextum]|nr:hypothetical protein LXA43DRAFT_1068375 [Ganoderma leucocontextum]